MRSESRTDHSVTWSAHSATGAAEIRSWARAANRTVGGFVTTWRMRIMRPSGYADERFGPVADAFARNFEDVPELGAAIAVYAGGRKVVDLTGGIADEATGRPWTSETVVPVFSCAKALVSLSIHLLVEEGRLDLDAPVAAYWPEFGKESITSRMVLGHRAGLPVLDRTLSFDEIAAWTPVVHAIEEQEPLWEPGTTYEYHG